MDDHRNGQLLVVLDNADNQGVFFNADSLSSVSDQQQSEALVSYRPWSSNCSLLITTTDKRVGQRLTNRESPIVVWQLEVEDAKQLLRDKIPMDIDWNNRAGGMLGDEVREM
jgi:hypothetical protein